MTKNWKISNGIVLGLLILICVLRTFYKHISFGHGLGDMFGYLVLYLGTLTHLILTLISRKKGSQRHSILTFIFLTFTILIILNATIWRGNEYKWNGQLFYLPCPSEITIDNQEIQKQELITMCTMDYYSKFSGNWNGQFISITSGNIKIPEELEEYIKRPINKVEIEPEYNDWHFMETGEKINLNFNKDTLQTSFNYELEGEIQAIRNEIPVIKVRIKK